MARIDKQYHALAESILDYGYEYKTDNRPQPCIQQTSATMDIELNEFPLLTTKKMATKSIVEELLWFLRGQGNIKPLVDAGVNIWNKDAMNYWNKDNGVNPASNMTEFLALVTHPDSSNLWNEPGGVGRNYGVQWRRWNPALGKVLDELGTIVPNNVVSIDVVDQIQVLLDGLRKPNPISRRHIVTAWNPAELDETALPPCHWAFEVLPRPMSDSMRIERAGGDKPYLEALWQSAMKRDQEAIDTLAKELAHVPKYGFVLKWHQRSVDTFLGLPFNIASYALLAHIIASITDMVPLSIIGDLSNVHFYKPHTEAVRKQLSNSVLAYPGCQLVFSENYLSRLANFKAGHFTFDVFLEGLSHTDFIFEGYQSFPAITAEMFEPQE